MSEIFISYASIDGKAHADTVRRQIAKDGNLTYWIDQESIEHGDEWRAAIDKGIRQCLAMIVIVTDGAWKSHNVTNEWSQAKALGKEVLPLRFSGHFDKNHPLAIIQMRDMQRATENDWQALNQRLRAIRMQADVPQEVKVAVQLAKSAGNQYQEAIFFLWQYEHPSTIEALAELASYPISDVRINAAIRFAEKTDHQDARCNHALIEGVRRGWGEAQTALQKISNPDTLPDLIALLEDPATAHKNIVISTLCNMQPDIASETVYALLAASLDGRRDYSPASLIVFLEQHGTEDDLQLLFDLANQYADEDTHGIVQTALKAMATIGRDQSLPKIWQLLKKYAKKQDMKRVHRDALAIVFEQALIAACTSAEDVDLLRDWLYKLGTRSGSDLRYVALQNAITHSPYKS